MGKSYIDERIEAIAEEQDISKQEAAKHYRRNAEYEVDFDNLPKQNHIWIDRGAKMSCENAGHHWHEVWKIRK